MKDITWRQIIKVIAFILSAIAGGAVGSAALDGVAISAETQAEVMQATPEAANQTYLVHIIEALEPAKNPALPEYKLPEGYDYTRSLVFPLTLPQPPNNKQLLYEAKERYGAIVSKCRVASVVQVDKFFLGIQPKPGQPVEEKPVEEE